MSTNNLFTWFRWLTLATCLLTPGLAEASSGVLKGTLRFHQRNGNYCPTGSTCTGARYLSTAWDAKAGIPEALIRLEKADGTLITTTPTDSAGNYQVAWSSGAGTGGVAAQIVVLYKDKDGAFEMRTIGNSGTHTNWFSVTPQFTLTHGTTTGSPQTYSRDWGTSGNPGQIANAYWAGYMANRYALGGLAGFTNVEVLAFDTANVTGCTTSCAGGWYKNMSSGRPIWADQRLTVVLDGSAATAYQPVERVMHELGHIADFVSVSNGHQRSTKYDRDAATPTGWTSQSEEYRPTALTEGLGSFLGVASFYADTATDPRTCSADGNSATASNRHCYDAAGVTDFRVELSNKGSCATLEGRWPLSATRYFWDIFDSTVDGEDNIRIGATAILNVMASYPCPSYPACYADGQLHDQFTFVASNLGGVTTSSTELDDGNAWHWRTAYLNASGTDVTGPFNQNCMSNW